MCVNDLLSVMEPDERVNVCSNVGGWESFGLDLKHAGDCLDGLDGSVLARKAAAHGCSPAIVGMIRKEGRRLATMNAEDLLNPFNEWLFAFGGMR